MLLAGESFIDGDLLVRHLEFEGQQKSIGADAFRDCLRYDWACSFGVRLLFAFYNFFSHIAQQLACRSLHPDDLRRLLFVVSGGAHVTLKDEKSVATVFIGICFVACMAAHTFSLFVLMPFSLL